jgi:hypothetical protein
MDERMKAEVEILSELVEHPGWAVLARNTQERIEAFQSGAPFNIRDEADLNFHRGVIATLFDLLALPEKLEAAKASDEDEGEG